MRSPAATTVSSTRAASADEVLYSISGRQAMTHIPNMYSIGVGAGWNSNLIYSDMSLETTLKNQLNGITNLNSTKSSKEESICF
jgi:hypothetical protein